MYSKQTTFFSQEADTGEALVAEAGSTENFQEAIEALRSDLATFQRRSLRDIYSFGRQAAAILGFSWSEGRMVRDQSAVARFGARTIEEIAAAADTNLQTLQRWVRIYKNWEPSLYERVLECRKADGEGVLFSQKALLILATRAIDPEARAELVNMVEAKHISDSRALGAAVEQVTGKQDWGAKAKKSKDCVTAVSSFRRSLDKFATRLSLLDDGIRLFTRLETADPSRASEARQLLKDCQSVALAMLKELQKRIQQIDSTVKKKKP